MDIQKESETEDPFPPPLKGEVEYILKSLKTRRASGPDKIENQTFKIFTDILMNQLMVVFNQILEQEKVPKPMAYIRNYHTYFIKRSTKTN